MYDDRILGALYGFSFAFIMMILLVILGIYILYIIGLCKLFKKAGKNGWGAIIPFYNTWVLGEISGAALWYPLLIIILNLIDIDNSYLSFLGNLVIIGAKFVIFYNLAKKMHKGTDTAVLLTFFSLIMIPIVGFSSSYQIDENVVVDENGPIKYRDNNRSSVNSSAYDKSNNENNDVDNSKIKFCSNCGKAVNFGVKFCGNCGNELRK